MRKATTAAFASGIIGSATGLAGATGNVTITGKILSAAGDPIPRAQITVVKYPVRELESVQLNSDGIFETTAPASGLVSLGFYKADEDHLHARRLDGVPHIHYIGQFPVSDEDTSLGELQLPPAYHVNARAVIVKKKGVEGARPGFAGMNDYGSWFGSRSSELTTNEEGFMKLRGADFTGVELPKLARVTMRPPEDDKRFDDEEQVEDLRLTDDTTITFDISRKTTRGNST